MESPNPLGGVIAACIVVAILLTAPIWVAFGSVIYAVLSVMF